MTEEDKTPAKEGYVLDETMKDSWTGNIAGDGSLVLKVYFKQQFTITYKPGDHGTFEDQVEEGLGYGVETPAFDGEPAGEAGYTFAGWEPAVEDVVTEDKEYVAMWSPNEDTGYTVEHYKQELDGTYPEKASEVEELEGTTGEEVEAKAKTYEGFELDPLARGTIRTGTIAADGSLVLKLYYKRINYPVTYVYEGDVPEGAPEVPEEKNYAYGADVPAAAVPSVEGYTFNGWNGEVETMPAKAVRVTGSFVEIGDAEYRVEYYLQDEVGGETYTLDESKIEDLTGKPGTTATATAKTIEGYVFDKDNANNVTSGTITEKELLILKLYYNLEEKEQPDDPVTYTLIYHTNYQSVVSSETEDDPYTVENAVVVLDFNDIESFTKTSPWEKDGKTYTFADWNVRADGSGTAYKAGKDFVPGQQTADPSSRMASIATSSGLAVRMAITTTYGGTYHLYAQWTTSDAPAPHLTVAKETTNTPANGTYYVEGEVITYKITVTNDGNIAISGITVTDELTEDEWVVEKTLAAGESEEFEARYTVTAADVEAGTVVNEATAKAPNPAYDPDTPDDPDNPFDDENVPVEDGKTESPTTDPNPAPAPDRDRDRDRDRDDNPVDDNPDEVIDDGDTPLAPGTIDDETDETIDDGDTPLAPYEEESEIDDEATPLTPFTGDDRHTAAWGFLSLLSLAGIVVLGKRRKEEE